MIRTANFIFGFIIIEISINHDFGHAKSAPIQHSNSQLAPGNIFLGHELNIFIPKTALWRRAIFSDNLHPNRGAIIAWFNDMRAGEICWINILIFNEMKQLRH